MASPGISLASICASWWAQQRRHQTITRLWYTLTHKSHCQAQHTFQSKILAHTFVVWSKQSSPALPIFQNKLSWPVLDLHNMWYPHNGGGNTTYGMPLISKGMRLTVDTHTSRSPLFEPLHHGLIKNIDPWWKKLLIHIMVPSFLQLMHVKEAILIWHLSIWSNGEHW